MLVPARPGAGLPPPTSGVWGVRPTAWAQNRSEIGYLVLHGRSLERLELGEQLQGVERRDPVDVDRGEPRDHRRRWQRRRGRQQRELRRAAELRAALDLR